MSKIQSYLNIFELLNKHLIIQKPRHLTRPESKLNNKSIKSIEILEMQIECFIIKKERLAIEQIYCRKDELIINKSLKKMRKILVLALAMMYFAYSAMIQTATLAPIIQVYIKQPVLISSGLPARITQSAIPIVPLVSTSSVSNIYPIVGTTSTRSTTYSQSLASASKRKRYSQTLFALRNGRRKNISALASSFETKLANQSFTSQLSSLYAAKSIPGGAMTSSQILTFTNPNNLNIVQYDTKLPLSTQKDKKTTIYTANSPKSLSLEETSNINNDFKGVRNTINGYKNYGTGNANTIVGQGNQVNGNNNSLNGNLNRIAGSENTVVGKGNLLY